MEIFEFTSYKDFIVSWVKKQPKKGRGQYRRLAQFLSVSPVIVTQVVKGDRQFNEEQALEACEFFGLSELERDYFLLLVQKERAGTHKLEKLYQSRLHEIHKKAREVKGRLPEAKALDEEAKAVFYSNWYYSGIRLITAVEAYQTPQAIADKFDLPLTRVREVLGFLVKTGLCLQEGDRFQVGVQSTHVDAKSPLVTRHHRNWRDMAARNLDRQSDQDLFFTVPTVVDAETIEQIRKILLQTIKDCAERAVSAPSEELRCLNIDWFRVV